MKRRKYRDNNEDMKIPEYAVTSQLTSGLWL